MRVNRIKNPSGRRLLTNYVLIGTGALGQDAGLDTFTTTSGSGTAGTRGVTLQTLTVGTDVVAGSTYIYSATISGSTCSVSLQITGSGVVGTTVASATISAGAGYTRTSLTFVAASSGTFTVNVVNVSTAAAGAIIGFRDAMLELGNVLNAYFDGATSGGFWTGTVDNSVSDFPNSTPVLTQFIDANPAPRILVTIPEVAPTCATVNVYRVAEGRQFKVRGGVNLFAVGGAFVVDYEAPLGVAMTYRAEMFDSSSVSLGFTATTTATIPSSSVPDGSYVWIHQPLKPTLAVLAIMDVETAADVARSNPGQLIYPEGATVATWIGGQRQGVAGMTITITCASSSDADEFLSMFGSYSNDFPAVLCFRSIPPVRIPRTFFAAVPTPHETTDYTNALPWIKFTMTADEVQPPSPGLVIPALRREDIDFNYTTRTARAAAYATRNARDTDYSLSGIAGP